MFFLKHKYFQQAADDLGGGEPAPDPTPTPDPEPNPDIQSTWQETWREDITGGDENKLGRISRYSSPTAVADALIAAQNKISSGDLSTPFPQEGTDEEKAAWRSDNGLPDSVEGYSLDFDNGIVVGEDDQPFIDEYLKQAHEGNQTPDQVKQNVQWYLESQQQQMEAQHEKDQQMAQETNDTLRAEWGQEYKSHKNAIKGLLDTMPEDIKDNFASARMADGSPVLSDPQFLQWALNQALEINPASTLVPPGSGDISGSINDEIATIEALQGDRSSEYWKGAKSEGMQKRLRDLYNARDKLKT